MFADKQVLKRTRLAAARHKLQLVEVGKDQDYIKHSIHGQIVIYNLLPPSLVETSSTVSSFQTGLQELVQSRILAEDPNWENLLSPRVPLAGHPLIRVLV